LLNLSFEIRLERTVAVVGRVEESTLARLLYRFYDVQQGRITIADQDIKRVTRPACGGYRHRAAGHGAFNDTVEYNIAYGKPGATCEGGGSRQGARIHGFLRHRWATAPWSASAA
jgi:ATP-binding cassette subfamily B protein